jgi:hypothetical protein
MFDEFHAIISEMSRLGHGGILAVLGPEDTGEAFLSESRVLAPPVPFGKIVRTQRDATDHISHLYREKDVQLSQARQQIVRLTFVDGAVLLSHSLDVLAFGVKLPTTTANKSLPEVRSVTGDGVPGNIWSLEARGTRHRAAAVFAETHPKGLAFIVSQDGDAAVFQKLQDKVVYWPLGIPLALGSE